MRLWLANKSTQCLSTAVTLCRPRPWPCNSRPPDIPDYTSHSSFTVAVLCERKLTILLFGSIRCTAGYPLCRLLIIRPTWASYFNSDRVHLNYCLLSKIIIILTSVISCTVCCIKTLSLLISLLLSMFTLHLYLTAVCVLSVIFVVKGWSSPFFQQHQQQQQQCDGDDDDTWRMDVEPV